MIDIVIFVGFLLSVIAISIFMSRGAKGSESYFLAGRGLGWWLIGFSLIAANISTEQFVGMSGSAANYLGLAIASYEWMAAATLVIVAFVFLPQFLKAGIYTIPEFLEKRYNKFSRTVMSLTMMIVLVSVNTAAVIYSGAKLYSTFFAGQDCLGIPLNLYTFAWLIGILSATYVFFGGLKACAWADLLQGSALIIGGGIVLYFALSALGNADPDTIRSVHATSSQQIGGELSHETIAQLQATSSGWERFKILNAPKLRMNLPWSDGVIPITALMLGLWIPNLYYWGLNQYIMQRTLGSKSLAEGQKGIVFAAFMKLLIPFIVVFPGMMAFNLYSGNMRESAHEKNTPILKRFENLRSQNVANKFFPFDLDFAKVEQEKALEIVTFNAAVVGLPVTQIEQLPSPEKLLEFNKGHYSEVTRKNRDTTTPVIAIETQLSGYDYDTAFPFLMSKLVPEGGFRGFLLAAMLGAVISSLASMLNAASTIFTMDLYKEYIHRKASDDMLVVVGRTCVVVFMVTSCMIAPMLGRPEFGGIFHFIQEFQGFISPGILAVFLFGFISRRAPGLCGPVALLMSPIVYGLLKYLLPDLAFLDRMAITLGAVLLSLTIIRFVVPRATPYETTSTTHLEMTPSRFAQVAGVIVLILTAALYIWFWDYATPMFGG